MSSVVLGSPAQHFVRSTWPCAKDQTGDTVVDPIIYVYRHALLPQATTCLVSGHSPTSHLHRRRLVLVENGRLDMSRSAHLQQYVSPSRPALGGTPHINLRARSPSVCVFVYGSTDLRFHLHLSISRLLMHCRRAATVSRGRYVLAFHGAYDFLATSTAQQLG